MSLRATTPYYSSAHTARKVSTTATGASGSGVKEGAKGLMKSPWIVGALPFINGGISGMVVSRDNGAQSTEVGWARKLIFDYIDWRFIRLLQ